jgi:hypothetical protein
MKFAIGRQGEKAMLKKLLAHAKDMISGRYGTVSSGRVLSFIFGLFTLVVLTLVVKRMLSITDPALMHEWVAALPALGGVLFGLTGLPYSATKAASSLAEIIAAIRKRGD